MLLFQRSQLVGDFVVSSPLLLTKIPMDTRSEGWGSADPFLKSKPLGLSFSLNPVPLNCDE